MSRQTVMYTALLALLSIFMLYPLIWTIGATFKSNAEIFSSLSPFTLSPVTEGYRKAFESYGGKIDLLRAMLNTCAFVIPKILFTVASCTLTAYGFARFDFRFKKPLFAVLMSTFFLPEMVLNVPQFALFTKLNWVDSPLYLPLVLPSLFAADTFFVFLLVQFFKGIPREFDDAAAIDGCGSFKTLVYVLCPMLRPALISCALFQFIWSSNDFLKPLLYVTTPERYPASVFVKLSMDADSGFAWNRVLVVSLISVIPSILVFIISQRYFTEDIAAGGLKG